nr:immunoglobulin heavy chain junction region [Mus musculus]
LCKRNWDGGLVCLL